MKFAQTWTFNAGFSKEEHNQEEDIEVSRPLVDFLDLNY